MVEPAFELHEAAFSAVALGEGFFLDPSDREGDSDGGQAIAAVECAFLDVLQSLEELDFRKIFALQEAGHLETNYTFRDRDFGKSSAAECLITDSRYSLWNVYSLHLRAKVEGPFLDDKGAGEDENVAPSGVVALASVSHVTRSL
jgi:hypothetical protein